ncbi:hypothetical protein PAXRUDRAFT_167320, partial [Paxillus rubicundulus Ve08.2h10]
SLYFVRHDMPVLDPRGLQIEREKGKGLDNNQCANLKDPATANLPKPPPHSSVTMKPPIIPNNPDVPSSTDLDPLSLNFEHLPVQTLRHSTCQ